MKYIAVQIVNKRKVCNHARYSIIPVTNVTFIAQITPSPSDIVSEGLPEIIATFP